MVSGDTRITNMANKTKHKTEHICGLIREDPASASAHPPAAAARRKDFRLALFSISNFESTVFFLLLFTYLYRRSIIDTYLVIYLNQYSFEILGKTRNNKSHKKKLMILYHDKVYLCSKLQNLSI